MNENNTARLWNAASDKLIASFDFLGPFPPGEGVPGVGPARGDFILVRTVLGS